MGPLQSTQVHWGHGVEPSATAQPGKGLLAIEHEGGHCGVRQSKGIAARALCPCLREPIMGAPLSNPGTDTSPPKPHLQRASAAQKFEEYILKWTLEVTFQAW